MRGPTCRGIASKNLDSALLGRSLITDRRGPGGLRLGHPGGVFNHSCPAIDHSDFGIPILARCLPPISCLRALVVQGYLIPAAAEDHMEAREECPLASRNATEHSDRLSGKQPWSDVGVRLPDRLRQFQDSIWSLSCWFLLDPSIPGSCRLLDSTQ